MRALLVVNPKATATTPRVRDVLARALASDLKLDVVETRRRGHAIDLARDAAQSGIDLVVSLGGDGTINEIVNGLVGSETALATVPGGSTNVFSRALGMSRSPVEAIGEILDALRTGRRRLVTLGQANDRYFTFCAGLGIDAEVVRAVERHRRKGKPATAALYVRKAVIHFFTGTDRRHPAVTLHRPGADPVGGLFLGIVANGSPWSYLGGRAVNPCPAADFDAGLDLLALRRLAVPGTLRIVRQMLSSHPHIRGKHVLACHDLSEFTLEASRPLAMQVDGDYIGERELVSFRAVPDALTVIA
ncbi:MAG: diacylglycerol kinase family protein [Mycobacteriales bacterium]